jgi:putative addiction module CopG family antidote
MRTTLQMSITLPLVMADMVKAKVQAGEYATESEVIRDGLRLLMDRDRAIADCLARQAGAAQATLQADSSTPVTTAEMQAHLAGVYDKPPEY